MFDYFLVIDPSDDEEAMETYNEMNETDQAKLNTCLFLMFSDYFDESEEDGLTKEQKAVVEAHKKELAQRRLSRIQQQENENHLIRVFDGLLFGQ